MIKTSNVALFVLIAFIVGFILGAVTWRKFSPCMSLPVVSIQRDTVTVRDTIRGKVQPPRKVEVLRVDTVRIELSPTTEEIPQSDTSTREKVKEGKDTPRIGQSGELLIPIESKTYETENYRAVISGWRPSLDSMEIYRQSTMVTHTIAKLKTPRWAVTAGPGVGYATGNKIVPYVGVNIGFVIWSR